MPYALLRRTPVANPAPATGFTVLFEQWDINARRIYREAIQATTNTGANAPFELVVGQLVPGASFCYGSTLRQVFYTGAGAISTRDNPSAPSCASNLRGLTLQLVAPVDSAANSQTAQLAVLWRGAAGDVTVRCALLTPGMAQTAPYYEERLVPAGTAGVVGAGSPQRVNFPEAVGAVSVPRADARGGYRRLSTVSDSAGLGPGRYRVEVTEAATGYTIADDFTIELSAGNTVVVARSAPPAATTVLTCTLPAGQRLLMLRVSALNATTYDIRTTAWDGQHVVDDSGTLALSGSGALVFEEVAYVLPAGTPVGGTAGVPVVSNGQGGVQTLAYFPQARLELANLVLFHPASTARATGGVVVEITNGYDTHRDQNGPMTYQLFDAFDAGGTRLQSNQTGAFDGLPHGGFSVLISDGYATPLTANFTLAAEYGLRWVLEFSDLKNGQPCRLELWPQGYAGAPESICGQAEPVTIQEEGIQGGDSQADLGPSVGKSMTLRLRAAPAELQDVMLHDRACRADFYYGGDLAFTGFIEQGIYDEQLLAGPVDVQLVATCGLAGLKDISFAGHVGQELRGRFSRLSTLLHCLSRTGLSLPLTVAANLRAAEMLADETPEEAIFTDRLGYADQDLRAVVDALCQSLGGTLVQRDGQWLLLSALEAAGGPATPAQPARRVAFALPPVAGSTAAAVTLAAWLLPPGALVAAGQPVALARRTPPGPGAAAITVSVFSPAAGVLDQVLPAGTTAAPGTAMGGVQVAATAALPAAPTPARRYGPAGTGRQLLGIAAPTGRLLPERLATAARAAGADRAWYWLNADQRLQRRAGWKYYTGTADAAYAENAFRQGDYFGLPDFWLPGAAALRPEAGWQPGPGGFPVSLVEAGGESEEVATHWPEAVNAADARYLESQLVPVEAGREGLPFALSVTAKFVAPSFETARLWVEIIAEQGRPGVSSLGAVFLIAANPSFTAGFATVRALIPAGLLPSGAAPRIRVHAHTVATTSRRRDGGGLLLVQKVALQVLPQGAKWDGKTAFVASGAGGSVRPGAPLDVFHVDAPDQAGLFLGTAAAFRRTLTRLPGIPTTRWARADDLRGAPLLASAVLDVLALRGNPSRLLTGTVRCLGRPPELLDSLDAPHDIDGRRWAVAARTWRVKSAQADLTLVEIGAGEYLAPPAAFLPQGVQLLRGLAAGRRRVLLSRRSHTARAVRP